MLTADLIHKVRATARLATDPNPLQKLRFRLRLATDPHPQVQGEFIHTKARTLATITLFLLPLHLFVSVILFVVYGPQIWSWRLVLMGGAGTLIAYRLSRTRYILAGINLFIVSMLLLALSVVYVSADSFSAVTVLLPMYFASMFGSFRRLVTVCFVSIVSVIVLSRVIPGDWKDIYGVILLLIVTSIMIAVRTRLQWQAESQLRQRNQQLAESETRFRAAIDASIGLFFLLKPLRGPDHQIQDFIVVDANTKSAAQLQIEYAALVNQPISVVIPAAYRDELYLQCKTVINEGKAAEKQFQTLNHVWEYQAVPVGDSVAVIGFDITARKEAEKRRVELQIERERVTILQRFIGDMSHDLMTPLSIISSSSYLLGKVQHPEQRDQHVRQINDQTMRLKGIFDTMLVQSRLDNLTRRDLACEAVDVNGLMQNMVASFQSLAGIKAQQLTFVASPQPALAFMDKASMEVALGNLVDNAIKYTPDGKAITVSCKMDVQEIIIVVEDSGIGIPVNELPLIFERFYRVEAHRPLTAGAGLGLSITKKIIELHGGTITAENRAEGGMRFCVSLRKA